MKLQLGPGALVAAAFIGPGTVTACTVAGASFGFALVWALVFATLSTIVLQDMAARLGAGARLGLGEAMVRGAGPAWRKAAAGALVFAALAVGNAAYEAGNIAGGALGVAAAFDLGAMGQRLAALGIAFAAGLTLWFGRYRVIEAALIVLVILMSCAFAVSAILARPDLGALASGLVPRVPAGGTLTAIALIGTTIVPYNLFLHAAAARTRWAGPEGVTAARADTVVSVGLGGLVSILILTTAAGALFSAGVTVTSAADMARAVEPAAGQAARYLVGAGLFGAGLTSAITAPMATAFALTEMAPAADPAAQRRRFRAVALAVVVIGAVAGQLGIQPVLLILFAQAANGLLLPIVAVFLLAVMNRKALLGAFANRAPANIAGAIVVLVTLGLGLRGILRALGLWP